MLRQVELAFLQIRQLCFDNGPIDLVFMSARFIWHICLNAQILSYCRFFVKHPPKDDAMKKALPSAPMTPSERKGAALKRWMREKEVTQTQLIRALRYKSRCSCTSWWRGDHWPVEMEPLIEEFLHMPTGFFASIGAGMPYDTAREPKRLLMPTMPSLSGREWSPDFYEALIAFCQGFQRELEAARRQALAHEQHRAPTRRPMVADTSPPA